MLAGEHKSKREGMYREILPWVLWCMYMYGYASIYGFIISSLAFMVLWMVVNGMAVGYV